jgi:hypothetical protein
VKAYKLSRTDLEKTSKEIWNIVHYNPPEPTARKLNDNDEWDSIFNSTDKTPCLSKTSKSSRVLDALQRSIKDLVNTRKLNNP